MPTNELGDSCSHGTPASRGAPTNPCAREGIPCGAQRPPQAPPSLPSQIPASAAPGRARQPAKGSVKQVSQRDPCAAMAGDNAIPVGGSTPVAAAAMVGGGWWVVVIGLGALFGVDDRVRAGDVAAWSAARADTAWFTAATGARVTEAVGPCSDSLTVARLSWAAPSVPPSTPWLDPVSQRFLDTGWTAVGAGSPNIFEKSIDGRRVQASLFAADQGPGGGVIATLVLTPNAWWC